MIKYKKETIEDIRKSVLSKYINNSKYNFPYPIVTISDMNSNLESMSIELSDRLRGVIRGNGVENFNITNYPEFRHVDEIIVLNTEMNDVHPKNKIFRIHICNNGFVWLKKDDTDNTFSSYGITKLSILSLKDL